MVLKERYLEPGETVEELWERVSSGNAEYKGLMERLEWLPNSPTLMNRGTGKGTLSACFKFDIQDSMLDGHNSIMGVACKAAAVAKWGGGVGYYLGNLRPKNSPIQSTHKVACGPVAVLKFLNEIGCTLITQGGRRELAQMGILPVTHQDIRDFIHCKDKEPQRLKSFNISVSVMDEFMKGIVSGLAHPDSLNLFDEIVDSAWRTGDPGLLFVDSVERDNPTPDLGKLTGVNPCGEVPLLSDEACNLGSINLGKFVWRGEESLYGLEGKPQIDWARLGFAVKTAVRFLDDVLDDNWFPHSDITAAVMRTRKIGLGVMGWADMLAMLGIYYDTKESVDLGGMVMESIRHWADDESAKLAEEKGPFRPGEKYRNATRCCIAPTGSISLLANASSGIEPHYALKWTRKLHAGHENERTIEEQISCLDKLPPGFVPKTAMQIPWEWHVKHQAAFQEHTDLAVSKTINLPNSATREDVRAAYLMMWKLGCKGGTVFRDGCRAGGEQVLEDKGKPSSVEIGKEYVEIDGIRRSKKELLKSLNAQARRKPPKERKSLTRKIQVGQFEGYATVGLYEDGSPCEVFVTASKEGSTVSGLLESWAIAFSHALQHGAGLQMLCEKFMGTRFEPNGLTGDSEVPNCTSVIDYVARWIWSKFGNEEVKASVPSGHLCPDCGSADVRYEGGCLSCRCGWSKC